MKLSLILTNMKDHQNNHLMQYKYENLSLSLFSLLQQFPRKKQQQQQN